MHQWTGKGKPEDVPGYYLGSDHKLAVDFIFYTGDRVEMIDEFELDTIPVVVPPPPTTGETMQGNVLRFTNIRSSYTQYSTDMGDLLAGDIVEVGNKVSGSDGLMWYPLTNATRNGQPVVLTSGKTVANAGVNLWAWVANIELVPSPPPDQTKTPFSLTVDGFKPFSGELEKE